MPLQNIPSLYNAKLIQDLPQNTPNPAPLAVLGWLTLSAHIAIMKLSFMWRVLTLPAENIYRRVMVYVLKKCAEKNVGLSILSPTQSMYYYAKYYGLDELILKSLNDENFGRNGFNKETLKKVVKQVEYSRWKASNLLYRNLTIYSASISKIEVHLWWIYANKFPHHMKKVSATVAVLCGSQPKNMQIFRQNHIMCDLCLSRSYDSTEHILFLCEALSNTRIECINRLTESMPAAMKKDFLEITQSRRLCSCCPGLAQSSQ